METDSNFFYPTLTVMAVTVPVYKFIPVMKNLALSIVTGEPGDLGLIAQSLEKGAGGLLLPILMEMPIMLLLMLMILTILSFLKLW